MTPVFNGSADLRQAAGQMIEETAKGARRKKEMNDAFLADLFANMTSLYHLDQIAAENGAAAEKGTPDAEGEKTESQPLPAESKALLGGAAGVWILIGAWKLAEARKAKRKG